jgi:hypothetical protein
MSTPAVDFTPGPFSPAIEPGFTGVAIRVEAPAQHGRLKSLRLSGVYRITVDQAREIGAIPLHKALVVTATSGLAYTSYRLVGETITFPDDERTSGGFVRGHFNADLLRHFNLRDFATGYAVVSLGPLLSNVATFSAAGAPPSKRT